MKNLLSNKTLQATYGGDVTGGSVVPGQLGAFLFLMAKLRNLRYLTRYRKKWLPESLTGQRSIKTRAKGSTGNQVLTAIPRAIKHRKRAAYLWGRVDRPIKEKKLTIQYGQNIYRQLEIFF